LPSFLSFPIGLRDAYPETFEGLGSVTVITSRDRYANHFERSANVSTGAERGTNYAPILFSSLRFITLPTLSRVGRPLTLGWSYIHTYPAPLHTPRDPMKQKKPLVEMVSELKSPFLPSSHG